jgi:VanZ family protein
MKSPKSNFLKYQLPVILWAVIILTLSSMPQFAGVKPYWTKYDKIAHFIEYGILGFLLTHAFYFQNNINIRKFAIILSIAIGAMFAGFDEIHQKYIPGRFNSIGDFSADFVGVIISQVFYVYYSNRTKFNLKFFMKIFKSK